MAGGVVDDDRGRRPGRWPVRARACAGSGTLPSRNATTMPSTNDARRERQQLPVDEGEGGGQQPVRRRRRQRGTDGGRGAGTSSAASAGSANHSAGLAARPGASRRTSTSTMPSRTSSTSGTSSQYLRANCSIRSRRSTYSTLVGSASYLSRSRDRRLGRSLDRACGRCRAPGAPVPWRHGIDRHESRAVMLHSILDRRTAVVPTASAIALRDVRKVHGRGDGGGRRPRRGQRSASRPARSPR